MNTTPLRFARPPSLLDHSAVLFDCDGTLADSMPAHFVAWRAGIEAAGGSFEFTWEEFLSRAGMSLERTAQELSERHHCALDLAKLGEVKDRRFSELEGSILGIPEVVDFAREVARSLPVAVVSGSRRESVETTLERIGVRELFPVIVTPEDVEHGKPDPEMFLLAAERLGVAPQRCLVLEDGASGIEAARRAGMDCLIVAPAPAP